MPTTVAATLPFILAMLFAGGASGLIAGLLGVGGGIVAVPVLELALSLAGIDPDQTMKIAVATSMATIVPTSISSSRAHARRGAVDGELVRAWALPIVIGAASGTILAAHLQSHWLSLIFATVASLVAVKMLTPLDNWVIRNSVPRSASASWLPFSIGGISTLMGIGGGSLSVPVMTLCNQPIHRAVGTGAMLGVWISIPATIGYLLADTSKLTMPPFNIGYVNFAGFAFIAPASWLAAPLGARLAHRMSRRHLSIAFGVFLLLVAVRMVYRALNA